MALSMGGAWGQQPVQSPGVTKPLWAGAAPGAQGSEEIDTPTLTAYLPSSNPTKTAVVIAPGGGYIHLSMDKEGEAIARWMNARGVAGFVLKYRLGPKYHHPVELGDAQRAIRTVRAQAEQYGIAADHIGMMGFSAGGHLASTAGTHFDEGDSSAADPIDRVGSRPDFLVLAYPVITMKAPLAHRGSHDNLLGPAPDPALEQLLSNELQVTARTPPTFLFSTSDDATVPVMNSVMFYSALHAANVPAELHIYEHGPHGVGLAPGFPNLKAWPDALAKWMATHGWMTADAASIVTTP
ncbi:alpha/beta hydrolase [Granulicella sp. WH15]|uniref:alpha/beta hydrolase n=1 Tax=Granulicella sp. WH15 TaxID=2602070 RepID=UPI00210661E8|nr:alpha/beta hydrolase [Granulicella sp. WH15]